MRVRVKLKSQIIPRLNNHWTMSANTLMKWRKQQLKKVKTTCRTHETSDIKRSSGRSQMLWWKVVFMCGLGSCRHWTEEWLRSWSRPSVHRDVLHRSPSLTWCLEGNQRPYSPKALEWCTDISLQAPRELRMLGEVLEEKYISLATSGGRDV